MIPGRIYAKDNDKLNIPFTISPVLPDNQKIGVLGYFDLQVQPGSKQVIHVKIRNDSGRILKMNITPANALTAVNGGIQYTADEGSAVSGFLDREYAYMGGISVQTKVTLAEGAIIEIPVTLTVPNKESGTFLGGLLFTEDGEGTSGQVNQNNDGANFTLKNRVAVGMAIQLDLPHAVQPEFSFGDVGMQTIPSGSQMYINMQDKSPAIVRGVKGSFEVSNASGTVMKGSFGPFNMAPETEIKYPVFWQNNLVPGKYTVKLNAEYGGQKVSEEKSFTIGSQELKDYQDVTGRNPISFTIPWWIWVLGILAFAAIIIFVYMIGRRQGRSKNNKQ